MRQKILIAKAIFPDVVARLAQQFDVESNQEDRLYSRDELLAKLRDKDGIYATPSTQIDAANLGADMLGERNYIEPGLGCDVHDDP